MKRIQQFFLTTLLGGITIILPTAILVFAIKWFFGIITKAIKPLTDNIPNQPWMPGNVENLIVILVIILICFAIGLFIRTHIGRFIFESFENSVLSKAPGYKVIKETVNQFLGNKKSPFSSVALVQLFGNETLATAFVTDTHADGRYTVFIPTGPNPTSGQIFHLEAKYVHPIPVNVEETMRSIISCGAGSGKLIEEYIKLNPEKQAD